MTNGILLHTISSVDREIRVEEIEHEQSFFSPEHRDIVTDSDTLIRISVWKKYRGKVFPSKRRGCGREVAFFTKSEWEQLKAELTVSAS